MSLFGRVNYDGKCFSCDSEIDWITGDVHNPKSNIAELFQICTFYGMCGNLKCEKYHEFIEFNRKQKPNITIDDFERIK